MMIIGGLTAIMAGIICFTDVELAWKLYELDSQQWGKVIRRSNNWREQVYIVGASVIILGIFAILLGIQQLA